MLEFKTEEILEVVAKAGASLDVLEKVEKHFRAREDEMMEDMARYFGQSSQEIKEQTKIKKSIMKLQMENENDRIRPQHIQ